MLQNNPPDKNAYTAVIPVVQSPIAIAAIARIAYTNNVTTGRSLQKINATACIATQTM